MSRAVEQALRATLENAIRAPYYRRAFGDRWKRVKTIDDLSKLPILDKMTAIENQRQLIVGKAPAGFGIASSGTTRREIDLPPLNVLTTREEAIAIDEAAFEEAERRKNEHRDAPPEPDPFPGWTLVVIAVTHGLPPAEPGPDELFVPWMYDRNSLYMLETVLSGPQPDGRRVTAMRLSVGALKCFTAWMLERGKDPRELGVKLIGTNSFRLSPFWRSLVERKFEAKVFDNYSLSEFATPATECADCGWLHFGWPPLIYEVLDLASGKRLDDGVGRLVLTGMHPFVQKMPLIRYDTGDVIELGPRCKATGARGIKFLGRARRGIVVKDGTSGVFALSPCFVQDVLEAFPETERSAHPLITLGHIKSKDIGLPRWSIQSDKGFARLDFEVRFDPHIFEGEAADLEQRVEESLLGLDAGLRRLVKKKKLRFEARAVASQSLRPPPDKYD
jgi:hypothetical protein